ncbi:MAG: ribokinase [Planctomycetes bacterium]|nr:ribokinase [Planctomycetota bacterium]
MGSIAVVGSINMDLVVRAERFPRPGETVRGEDVAFLPGGKGANQAVAAARLGGRVAFVGAVGDDPFGSTLLENLRREGIDAGGVERREGTSSGIALITLDRSGENHIVLSPGANGCVRPADVEARSEMIRAAGLLLLQLEIPMETVRAAAAIARGAGRSVCLNPAPAAPLPPDLASAADILVLNETEAEVALGRPGAAEDAIAAAEDVRRKTGARVAALTLGARGAAVAIDGRAAIARGFPVEAVDTTAAGDAFVAAFALEVSRGANPFAAARFANAAGALAVTRLGAQPSLPRRDDVERFLLAFPAGGTDA